MSNDTLLQELKACTQRAKHIIQSNSIANMKQLFEILKPILSEIITLESQMSKKTIMEAEQELEGIILMIYQASEKSNLTSDEEMKCFCCLIELTYHMKTYVFCALIMSTEKSENILDTSNTLYLLQIEYIQFYLSLIEMFQRTMFHQISLTAGGELKSQQPKGLLSKLFNKKIKYKPTLQSMLFIANYFIIQEILINVSVKSISYCKMLITQDLVTKDQHDLLPFSVLEYFIGKNKEIYNNFVLRLFNKNTIEEAINGYCKTINKDFFDFYNVNLIEVVYLHTQTNKILAETTASSKVANDAETIGISHGFCALQVIFSLLLQSDYEPLLPIKLR